ASNVLYLPNPSTYLDRMRQSDGTIKAFGMFDLPDEMICTDVTGATFEYSDGSTRAIPGLTTTACRTISQTSQTISEFDTADSFAIDRQTIGSLIGTGTLGTGDGKIVYYACTQDLEQ